MLKLVTKSTNKKLGNIASTYRAGAGNVYSTCPSSCPMKPDHSPGTNAVDGAYLEALLSAVPRGGISWTYTHFPREQIPLPGSLGGLPETTINISTDTVVGALTSFRDGYPTVIVEDELETERSDRFSDVQVVRCPAEYREEVTCQNCGNGNPLCARPDRNFVVKFTAHGSGKRWINERRRGESEENGGCYGGNFPIKLHWGRVSEQVQGIKTEAEELIDWVGTLQVGTLLRSHVLGDVGLPH